MLLFETFANGVFFLSDEYIKIKQRNCFHVTFSPAIVT